LRVFVHAPAAPLDTLVAQPGSDMRGDLTRLFGTDAPPPAPEAQQVAAADPRFELVGVVSPRSAAAAREGVALIAIDGNPARAYRVGTVVDGNTVLQAVSARGVQLGPRGGPAAVSLELAPLPAAATGTLPSIGGPAAQGFPPSQMRPQALPVQMRPAGMSNGAVLQQQMNEGQPEAQDSSQVGDPAQLR
jgi:general secretion pathway protein C